MVTTDTQQTITGSKTISGNSAFTCGVNSYNITSNNIKFPKILVDSNYQYIISGLGYTVWYYDSAQGYARENVIGVEGAYSKSSTDKTKGFVSNNKLNLGSSRHLWNDLYLAGNLSDGTNSVSIADLAALITYAKGQGWIQ